LFSYFLRLSNFNGLGTISLFKMAKLSWVEFDSVPYAFKPDLLDLSTSLDIDLYLSDLLLFNTLLSNKLAFELNLQSSSSPFTLSFYPFKLLSFLDDFFFFFLKSTDLQSTNFFFIKSVLLILLFDLFNT